MVDYPADWEVKKLGEIGEWESGSTPSRNNPEYYKNGKIFWVKNTDLNDNILKSSEEKITEKALKENFLKIQKPGTILIAMYCGETVGKLSILDVPATTNQNCCACELYKGFYNKFIFYSLLFRRKEIQGLSLFGGLAHISKKIITNYSIPLPPLAEQKAIAETLETFDAHIKNLSELIEKKKAIRDGALEDLMTGRTRLKGFSGGWEVKKLGEIVKIIRGVSYNESDAHYSKLNDDCIILRGGNILEDGNIDIIADDNVYINCSLISEAQFLKKNDIVIVASTASMKVIGKPGIITNNYNDVAPGAFLLLIRPIKNKNIFAHYITLYFRTNLYKDNIKSIVAGGVIQNIRRDYIMNLLIPLPPLAEQQAIAETLTAFDDEIKALEAERDKIIKIRDGAMNDLLTGKVRLNYGN